MSNLDRHIRQALLNGNFEFTDSLSFRFLKVGNLELCKDYRDRWYLVTGLDGGVELSWVTRLYLDLVRIAYRKAPKS
jgi:hypothetical protein